MKIQILIILLFLITKLHCQIGNHFFGSGTFSKSLKDEAGNIYFAGIKNNKLWFAQFSPYLVLKFEKTIGINLTKNWCLADFIKSSDGNFYIGGTLMNGNTRENAFLLKIDQNGDIIWQNEYIEIQNLYCIYEDQVNASIYFGGTDNFPASSRDGIIYKTDLKGKILSRTIVSIYNQNFIKYIDKNAQGNLILFGRTNVVGTGFSGIFCLEMDSSYKIINQNLIDFQSQENNFSSFNEHPYLAINKLSTGNYQLAHSNGRTFYHNILEIDNHTKLLRTLIFPEQTNEEFLSHICNLQNGDFLICGLSRVYDNNGGNHYYSFASRLNNSGIELWKKYIALDNFKNSFYTCGELFNNNLFFAGNFGQPMESWLLQTEADGNYYENTLSGKIYFDINKNCIVDNNEPTLSNIILSCNNKYFSSSDRSGKYSIKTDKIQNNIEAYPNTDYLTLCSNNISVDFSNTNSKTLDILFQPIDDCAHLAVEINQPDFINCQKLKYTVSVQNLGIQDSKISDLEITLDQNVSIDSLPPGFKIQGQKIFFKVPALKYAQVAEYNLFLKSSCDIQYGSSISIKAKIITIDCDDVFKGPKLSIESECNGDETIFKITNIGTEDMKEEAHYNVMRDLFKIHSGYFKLNKNEHLEIKNESKGRTIFIDVDDPSSIFPKEDYYFATQEYCGRNKNGMHSVGFNNAYRREIGNAKESYSYAESTLGLPNQIKQLNEGLGIYHFVENKEWLEYEIRLKNNTNRTVQNIIFELFLTPSLDLKSFQLLNTQGEIQIKDSSSITIQCNQLTLPPASHSKNSDFYIKFKVKPKSHIFPDTQYESFFAISGFAILDKLEHIDLFQASNNYTETTRMDQSTYGTYPPEVSVFGGKAYDFGVKIVNTNDTGSYLLIQSSSFIDNFKQVPYIVKLDKKDKLLWEYIPNPTPNYIYSIQGGTGLKNGDLLICGQRYPSNNEDNYGKIELFVLRIDANKNLIWEFIKSPGLPNLGGSYSESLELDNGDILICGYANTQLGTTAYDNFILKLDRNGKLIWHNNYIVDGLAFDPTNIFVNEKHEIFCLGEDEGRSLLVMQKLDLNGNSFWIKTHTPQTPRGSFNNTKATLTENDQIIFGVDAFYEDPNTGKNVESPIFLKFNSNGNFLQQKALPLGLYDYAGFSTFKYVSDHTLIITGDIILDTTSTNYYSGNYIAKINLDFDTLWQKITSYHMGEQFSDIEEDKNKNIKLFGYDQGVLKDHNLQSILLRLDGHGNQFTTVQIIEKNSHQFDCYPNPSQGYLTLKTEDNTKDKAWNLTDINGKIIAEGEILSTSTYIDLTNIPKGSYALRLFPSGLIHIIVIQ